MASSALEIVQNSFSFMMKNKIVFVPFLILTILSLPLNIYYYNNVYNLDYGNVPYQQFSLPYALLSFVTALFSDFVYVWTINLSYSITKKKVSLENSAKVSLSSFLKFIFSSILYALIVVAGFILLIIPGIYLAIRMSFYPYAIVLDKESVVGSLKKSWKITKKRWWFAFSIGAIMGIIALFVVLPLYLIAGIVFYKNLLLSTILISLVSIIFSSWNVVSYTSAYLKLRK